MGTLEGITPRLSAERLAPYPVVVAPRPAALSDAEIASLKSYVEAGGTLLVTGGTGV
ncbi:beta-galactosidase trimerization domain-containing protein [Arthrobacter sp. D1-29]